MTGLVALVQDTVNHVKDVINLQTPISRDNCQYTACYCEENVYILLKDGQIDPKCESFVCFISNQAQRVPLWRQRSGLAIWDYHVILIHCPADSEPLVYDLDTTLDFPCPLSVYKEEALRDVPNREFNRLWRIVPADLYLQHFGSDRSHMMIKPTTDSESIEWLAPPPKYPCIKPTLAAVDSSVGLNTLPKYLSMATSELVESTAKVVEYLIQSNRDKHPYGVLTTEDRMLEYFYKKRRSGLNE